MQKASLADHCIVVARSNTCEAALPLIPSACLVFMPTLHFFPWKAGSDSVLNPNANISTFPLQFPVIVQESVLN